MNTRFQYLFKKFPKRTLWVAISLLYGCLPLLANDQKDDLCALWRFQMDTTNNLVFAMEKSVEVYKEVDEECQAKIDILVGEVHMINHKSDSAHFYTNKGILKARAIGSSDALALGLNKKASLYIEEEKFDSAKVYLAKSRNLLMSNTSSKRWAGYFYGMGNIADMEGDYKRAISYIDSTINFGYIKDSIGLAISYHNRGVYQMRLSDFESSAESFINAYTINSKIEGGDIAANCLMLGTCYNSWKRYEPAKKYLETGITAAIKNNNNDLLIKLYNNLATNLRLSGKGKEALLTIDKVLVILEDRNDNFEGAKAKLEKARILSSLNADPELAITFAKEAYDQAQKSIPLAQIGPTLEMANFNIKSKNYTEAKSYLDEGEKLLARLNRTNYEAEYNLTLSNYYEGTQQFERALTTREIYQKLTDSIANKEVLIQVAALERKFNTQQNEMDILRLNQENAIQSEKVAKAKASRNFYLLMSLLLAGLMIVSIFVYQKLRSQKQSLDKALTRAEELGHVKNRLFSVISHDIRSMIFPFTRGAKVIGYHLKKGNNEKALTLAKEMEQNAENLSNVVDNLLKWSLDQMEGYEIKKEKISIHEEFQEIFGVYAQHAKEKNIDFETEGDKKASFLFDKGAFHVIFRNLIGNAIKFTENGSVEVKWKVSDQKLNVMVSDTGTGMEENVADRLFEFNEPNSKKGTQGEKGSGVGLQLVQQFVNKLNGKIEVSSQLGIGSQFRLIFPQ